MQHYSTETLWLPGIPQDVMEPPAPSDAEREREFACIAAKVFAAFYGADEVRTIGGDGRDIPGERTAGSVVTHAGQRIRLTLEVEDA